MPSIEFIAQPRKHGDSKIITMPKLMSQQAGIDLSKPIHIIATQEPSQQSKQEGNKTDTNSRPETTSLSRDDSKAVTTSPATQAPLT